MAGSHNPTFGATIEKPTPPSLNTEYEVLAPPPAFDSPCLTPAASQEDMRTSHDRSLFERPIPPYSPFYNHPPTSIERMHSRQNSRTQVNVMEKDVESGHPAPLSAMDEAHPFGNSTISVDYNRECKMWPSRETQVQTHLAEKKRRREGRCCGGCGMLHERWSAFSHKQKLWIKIITALMIVAIAVVLGVCISKAVGGGVWDGNSSQAQVGSS